ncbi:hypothetical protein R6Z07F_019605 [Ovis aries]
MNVKICWEGGDTSWTGPSQSSYEDSNEERFVHDLGKTKRVVFTVTRASLVAHMPQRHWSWGWRKSLELGRSLPPHLLDGLSLTQDVAGDMDSIPGPRRSPICHRGVRPRHHSYLARALEPETLNCRAHKLQLLKLCAL